MWINALTKTPLIGSDGKDGDKLEALERIARPDLKSDQQAEAIIEFAYSFGAVKARR